MSYHSALTKPLEVAPCNFFQVGESIAFVHDIRRGLPTDFDPCDVFYTDLPWQGGFLVFEARTKAVLAAEYAKLGVTTREPQTTYPDFLRSVGEVIRRSSKPMVLVTGRRSMPFLPEPSFVYSSSLNGAPAVALCYSLKLQDGRSATKILSELASRFHCVGDFCCGYGRTARTFHAAGKRFIVSDYNPRCIGQIAKEFGSS